MNELVTFLDSIGNPKILVVGDIILDGYTWGDVERVSPEAPVLVLKTDAHEVRLGGAASVANLLRALEADVSLAGVTGDDGNGRVARRLMDDAGIDSRLVHCDEARPTTSKQRLLGRAEGKHPHHILRVDEEYGRVLTEDIQHRLLEQILNRLSEFDIVLISDYAKGVFRADRVITTSTYHDDGHVTVETDPTETILLKAIIHAANEHGIPILVDPSRMAECDCYRGATLLKPNRVEAGLISGVKITAPDAAMKAGELLCQRLGLEAAVITLDHDGMVLSRKNGPSEHFPISPRAICDITGAGDMALATLGLALAPSPRPCGETPARRDADGAGVRGFSFSSGHLAIAIRNAVQLANIASGLQVERFGVTAVTRDEIRAEILRPQHGDAQKFVPLETLIALVERERQQGKTIVFTNGCFDLLHAGHVAMLQEAATLGDVLIIAINSDENIRRLKGDERPIIPEQDRARILAALSCVDHVLIFDEPTPHELLRRIRPDVLVKGGTTTNIVGREVVESYGGRVERTGEIPGLSTTALLSRIHSSRPILSQEIH